MREFGAFTGDFEASLSAQSYASTAHDNFAVSSTPLLTSDTSAIGTMGADMFGAIFNNYFGFDDFVEDTATIGLDMIRFPGGSISERGIFDDRIRLNDRDLTIEDLQGDRSGIAFDLTHPELISPLALEKDEVDGGPNNIATFSEVLALGVERGSDVGLVVPISRYQTTNSWGEWVGFERDEVREEAIQLAKSDISTFLERLKNGHFNDGQLPPTIIFELGNEQYDNPIEYAVLTKAMIEEIVDNLGGTGISYEIALQMPRANQDFWMLDDDYFEAFYMSEDEPIPGLSDLEEFVGSVETRDEMTTALSEIMVNIFGDSLLHVDALRHHLLGYNSDRFDISHNQMHGYDETLGVWLDAIDDQGGSSADVDYYMSAWTTNSGNAEGGASHLAAAVNTLELFAYFVEQGVDRAAVWGIVGEFTLDSGSGGTVISDVRSGIRTPQAAILELMAQNIKDSTLLDSGQHLAFDDSRVDDYRMFLYESETHYSAFYAVEELEGSGLTISADLGSIGDADYVYVTNLGTENGIGAGAASMDQSISFLGDEPTEFSFDQDYEIVLVTIPKDPGGTESHPALNFGLLNTDLLANQSFDLNEGTEANDIIVENAGSTVFWGGDGDDTFQGGSVGVGVLSGLISEGDLSQLGANDGDILFGGAGNDSLQGNRGNDWISGGEGDDELWGGSGMDTFVFSQGNDTVHDFNALVDTLIIDLSLLDGAAISQEWFEERTSYSDGVTSIDFGNGNSLTIMDELSLGELVDHIEFL